MLKHTRERASHNREVVALIDEVEQDAVERVCAAAVVSEAPELQQLAVEMVPR